MKYEGEYLDRYLLQLINSFLEQNEISKQWKEFYVISLYKKGSRKDPRNYKIISVNNILSRFAKIIHNKLQESQGTLLMKIKMISVQIGDV